MTITLPKQSKLLSKQFVFGVATASFQIEGGVEHRLPCIWDTFCATEGKIADRSNGDVACDHYNRWQQDIDLIESLGVDAYRLSISWPRVLDKQGNINQEGVDFYIGILERLNQKNIKPFVTLYHWDLPQHLEDQGGWLNRQTAYDYAEYVEKVVLAFGDRVHSYATFNEPFCSAYLGYEAGIHAPGQTGQAKGRTAAHHILLAHGLGMQKLAEHSPNTKNGIVLNFTPCYPESDSSADKLATEKADQYINQWYMMPVMEGKYPEVIEDLPVENRPPVEDGDMAIIAHPLDYLGLNYYTRLKYRASDDELFEEIQPDPSQVETTDIGWEVYPTAFFELLTGLHARYDLPPIYITENGAATDDHVVAGEVVDEQRIRYYNAHLNAVHNAIEAGVDIQGYFAWSLMDNFEWAEGYEKRFGIVYVDYQTQQRTIKNSGKIYRDLITTRV
ncbi:GH1 family beta-glucosidase [Thalassotalea agarivorans]|uniref:Beta-glucosidase n=1 Tax=Thalassotalea agarivorans TaxID=349064 RepID=A0A1I0E096_THASX|nr:GH1 family beta-glucosidase [Thalassotalea agarivorans]SET38452.1 beta-glucosidase [Thalassotalea agarivorans]